MKLTAIMLLVNSFLANQHGVEVVVDKVIQPLQQISADAPLNKQEYLNEVNLVKKVSDFCRSTEMLDHLASAHIELMNFYQDISTFENFVSQLKAEHDFDLVEMSNVAKTLFTSSKNDMLSKLSEFEAQVIKRGELSLLEDVKLLRQVITGTSRFIADLRSLVVQVYTTDVELTRSFLADDDVEKLAKKSSEHFKAELA